MTFDFELNGYQVTADVTECRDGYGTGDSPTLYDVDIIGAIDDDGNEVELNDLGKFFYEQMVDEAINIYRS